MPTGKTWEYSQVKELIEKYGYKLLSKEYTKSTNKLDFMCLNGHKFSMRFSHFNRGCRCLVCFRNKSSDEKKLSYNYIKDFIEKTGYKLLSDSYAGWSGVLSFKCPSGHVYESTYGIFHSGSRCPVCAAINNKKWTYKSVNKYINGLGFTLLSDSYGGYESILKIMCNEGHIFNQRFHTFVYKERCPTCSSNKYMNELRHNFAFVKSYVEGRGYKLLSKEYKNSYKDKIEVECKNGHKFDVRFGLFKNHETGCPNCVVSSSGSEMEVYECVKSFTSDTVSGYRVYKPKFYEIDVYSPSLKIGIEYHGLYYHSETFKDKNYHSSKCNVANKDGIRLIQIFEDEWLNKRSIVESIIKSVFGKFERSIFARKCVIKEVSYKDAKEFLNFNHIQGAGTVGNIRIGLYYEDKLVSLMTFSRPSISKNQAGKEYWELYKQCSILNTKVVGGFSRLLSYFIKTYGPKKIVSYCDRRYFDGHSYVRCGFSKVGVTVPNYYYIDGKERKHRFSYRKDVLVKMGYDKSMTEKEITESIGLYRIYDAGHIKLEWNK